MNLNPVCEFAKAILIESAAQNAIACPMSILFILRDGPFDIQGGGGWDFFEKNSLFPIRSEKNKMSSKKLKIKSLFFIQ